MKNLLHGSLVLGALALMVSCGKAVDRASADALTGVQGVVNESTSTPKNPFQPDNGGPGFGDDDGTGGVDDNGGNTGGGNTGTDTGGDTGGNTGGGTDENSGGNTGGNNGGSGGSNGGAPGIDCDGTWVTVHPTSGDVLYAGVGGFLPETATATVHATESGFYEFYVWPWEQSFYGQNESFWFNIQNAGNPSGMPMPSPGFASPNCSDFYVLEDAYNICGQPYTELRYGGTFYLKAGSANLLTLTHFCKTYRENFTASGFCENVHNGFDTHRSCLGTDSNVVVVYPQAICVKRVN